MMEEAKKTKLRHISFRKTSTGLRGRRRVGETIIQALLFFSGFVSIFTTIGIVYELGKEALLFFQMPEVKYSRKSHQHTMAAAHRKFRHLAAGYCHVDDNSHRYVHCHSARIGGCYLFE